MICQQWTRGTTSQEHAESFKKQAEVNLKLSPIAINSHTGKDHFGTFGNLKILKAIKDFEETMDIPVFHETQRGRFAFASHCTSEFLDIMPKLKLTADISHWCCVAESYLEDQEIHLKKAFKNSWHIHARIWSTPSPQVNNPESPEWESVKSLYLSWWKRILEHNNSTKDIFPITCEFGPWPYTPPAPFTREPMRSQWEANLYIKNWLMEHL